MIQMNLFTNRFVDIDNRLLVTKREKGDKFGIWN